MIHNELYHEKYMVDVTLSVEDIQLIQWIQAAQDKGITLEEWLIHSANSNSENKDKQIESPSTEIGILSGLAERAWDRRAKAGDSLAQREMGNRDFLRLDSIRGEPVIGSNIGRLENELLPSGLLRLLPMKHALRLLWSLTSETKRSLPDGALRNAMNQMLRLNGQKLAEEDNQFGRGRGERLAAGFSHLDDSARSRAVNWMIGSPGGSTKLSAMEIIGWSTKDSEGYRLTPHGLDLAKLPNPILDRDLPHEGPFSPLERTLILDSIHHRLPMEWNIMRTLIDGMRGGAVGNERLDARMKRKFGEGTTFNWTNSILQLRRVAAVTRMSELGLVIRRRDGRKTLSELSEDAINIIEFTESGPE